MIDARVGRARPVHPGAHKGPEKEPERESLREIESERVREYMCV